MVLFTALHCNCFWLCPSRCPEYGNAFSIYSPYSGGVEMSSLSILAILAIFFWVGGYFMTAWFMSTTGFPSDPLDNIISPPKWLYYLCGAPVSKEYPKGTLRVGAFRGQMAGISLGLFCVWSFISKASTTENIVGFALSMAFTLVLTSYISKRYVLRNQPRIHKSKK